MVATLPAQIRGFKLRISAILCKNSSDLFLDTMGSQRYPNYDFTKILDGDAADCIDVPWEMM